MRPADAVADIDHTVLGVLGDYLRSIDASRRYEPSTIIKKHQTLTAAQRSMRIPLESADRAEVRAWWDRLCTRRSVRTGRRLGNTTLRTTLAHMRGFYGWCLDGDVIAVDPTRGILSPKAHRGTPRDVDVDQAVTAISSMGRGPVRTACSLAMWCGMRRAEIATVRPSTDLVHRQTGAVLVVTGKGSVRRHTPVPTWLAEDLSSCPEGWLLPSQRSRSGHWTPDHLGTVAARQLRRNGLDATMHQLRHTFGTNVYRATGDIRAVMEVMGHAQMTTTTGYVRGSAAAVVAVIDDLYGGRPT